MRKNRVALVLRNREIDSWTCDFLARNPAAAVVHIGCGLDSWIDVKYRLAGEIISGTDDYYMNIVMGLLLAVLYLTVYRWLRPRLPAGLRMETVNLTWRDLRLPGPLFVTSVILGLLIIT